MVGGGQKSLLLLLERLNKSRFRPFLTCPTPGEMVDKARAMGIETAIIPMPPLRTLLLPLAISVPPWLGFKSLRTLIRFIRTHNIHLIHTDTPRQAFYLGIAGLLCHKPMIWHIRTSEKQNRLFDRLLFAMSRRVIPVSHAAAIRFRHLPGQHKIQIIYNGIDVADYAQSDNSRSVRAEFAPNGELLIGTAGQLVPEKGLDTFIEAAAQVLKEVKTKIRFLIIGRGTGDYTAYLQKKAADLGIADNVTFTGFRRDMPHVMAALDIFVLATKAAEGLSRVILEAMACSVPVITTKLGGNPELVIDGETGILVQTDNPKTFASAMVDLIKNDQQRKTMGIRGRERAKSEFDLTATINALEHIYQEVL